MLQKVPVEIQFTGGIDRASDDHLVLPTKAITLDNLEFGADRDTVQTRDGWKPLISGGVYSGDSPGTMRRLMHLGAELLVESTTGLHSADVTAGKGKWKQQATALNRCAVDLEGVFHGHGNVYESDVGGTDSLKVILYSSDEGAGSSSSRVFLCVIQNDVLIRHERIDTTSNGPAVCPRVVYSSADSRFYLYWAQDTNAANPTICGTSLLATALGATLTITSIKNDYAATGTFDAVWHPYASGGGAVFLCYQNAAASLHAMKLSKADGVTIQAQASSIAYGTVPYLCCVPTSAVGGGRAGYVVAFQQTAGAGLVDIADLDNGAPVFNSVSGVLIGGTASGRMTAMTDPNNTANFFLVWEEATPGTRNTMLFALNWRTDAFGAPASFPTFSNTNGFDRTEIVRSVGLASGLHTRGRSVYVGAVHYSLEQAQHHEIEIGRTVAGASTAVTSKHDVCCRLGFNGGFLYDSTFGGVLPSLYRASGGSARPPAAIPKAGVGTNSSFTLKQRANGDRVITNGLATGYDVTPLGLDVVSYHWSVGLNEAEIAGTLVLAGGNPLQWDGETLSELGFEQYPEAADITLTAAAGVSGAVAGSYGVVVCYEWVDKKGNKFLSRPSTPKLVTLAANDFIQITVPTLRITRKSGVKIVAFITEAGGSIYYRTPTTGTSTYYGITNVTTADTVSVNTAGSLASASIVSGELLYTTGGVLSNSAYPACKHVAVVQERLWFAGAEENQIRYSEERSIGFFPGTNEVYVFETNTGIGRVSALEGLDDKVVVLQESQIGVIYGRGPNRLGQLNEFSPITKVLGGVGHSWDESNAVALDSDGLWFRDPERGLRHLNRGLQLTEYQNGDKIMPAGSEVDSLLYEATADGLSVRGAAVYPAKKQVRFTYYDGILVWDFENKQWSRFTSDSITNYSGIVVTDNEVRFIATGSEVYREQAGTTVDATSTRIRWTFVTAWIKLNTLTGFQRIYSVQLLGKFRNNNTGALADSGETLDITTTPNYNVGLDQSVSVSSTFSNTNWHVFGEVWQLEHKPSTQKCESVQLTLVGRSKLGTRITGISLQVGVKRGMFKTARSQRF